MLQEFGVYIAPSQVVPGGAAGLGVFAARSFSPPKGKKGNQLRLPYTGDRVATRDGKLPGGFGGSHYVFQLTRERSIDAARTNSGVGRMVNAARGSGKKPNEYLCPDGKKRTASIVATQNIDPGDEIIVAYGSGFWATHPQEEAK